MAEPFSPKKQFQANTVQREEFAQIIANPIMDRAFTVTIAHLVTTGLSPDRLAGVGNFINALRELSEPDKEQKPFPVRQLTSLDETPNKPKP